MKLLLDQNISFRLMSQVRAVFPDIYHIKDLNLWDSNDYDIFMVARQQKFDAIITLDADFVILYQQFGTPPKVVWIRTGNVSTRILADILQHQTSTKQEFLADTNMQCLHIF